MEGRQFGYPYLNECITQTVWN